MDHRRFGRNEPFGLLKNRTSRNISRVGRRQHRRIVRCPSAAGVSERRNEISRTRSIEAARRHAPRCATSEEVIDEADSREPSGTHTAGRCQRCVAQPQRCVQDQRKDQACWRGEEFASMKEGLRMPRPVLVLVSVAKRAVECHTSSSPPRSTPSRWTTRAPASRGGRFLIHHHMPDCPALPAATDDDRLARHGLHVRRSADVALRARHAGHGCADMQTSSGSLTGCTVSDPGTSSRGSDAPGTAATDQTAPFAGERRREPRFQPPSCPACCHPKTRVAGQRTSFFLYVRSAATEQAWKTGHQRRTLSPERTQRHKSPSSNRSSPSSSEKPLPYCCLDRAHSREHQTSVFVTKRVRSRPSALRGPANSTCPVCTLRTYLMDASGRP